MGLVSVEFPYPAKRPGGCRFPSTGENANFQEYGEEPVVMSEAEFESWWFFYEDPDKPGMSHVGTDRHNRCILERRYVHGDLSHWTVEKRFFLIKRNIMASCLALALIEDAMERNDYTELIARLDYLVPPTGDPLVDGCQPLLPPQELLDRKSKSEIEAEEKEKEWKSLNGQLVWQDDKRKLYFEGNNPVLTYKGERYTFSCQPYEPMAIILRNGEAVVYIHNAFYPDECKGFIENRDYLVGTITGKHHNAERFCRLLTTAIDNHFDCQIGEVEDDMQKQMVEEKGIHVLQFETRDFKCDKVLYEGIYLLLGYFETALSRKYHVDKQYSIAFGYPNRNSDYYEYYLLSEHEYHEFQQWPEKRLWKDKEEAFDWQHKHLEGKKQVLCNEFRQNPAIYKPVFTLDEIPENKSHRSTILPPTKPTPIPHVRPTPHVAPVPQNKPTPPVTPKNGFKFTLSKEFNQGLSSHPSPVHSTIQIKYSRVSVCAADDYVNRDLTIKLPSEATVGDLVDYIQHYYDGNSYSAIPYTGGNWWTLKSNKGILAEVNDDGEGVRYNLNPSTPLKGLGITTIDGTRSR